MKRRKRSNTITKLSNQLINPCLAGRQAIVQYDMTIPINYEDSVLLVVDKPAGVVINKSDTVKETTLQHWVEERLKIDKVDRVGKVEMVEKGKGKSTFYQRAGIVHRLDKDTSGLLIIAKTPESFLTLQSQFKNRQIVKKYVTLVHGKLSGAGEIKASVGRLPWNRERFGVLPGGREALTLYKSLKLLKSPKEGETLTFLEVTPHTGRTHQMRIHLKYIGHPVVADRFYAGRKTYIRDIAYCPRLFLHATSLDFIHPVTGEPMALRSPLPRDLEEVLQRLSGRTPK